MVGCVAAQSHFSLGGGLALNVVPQQQVFKSYNSQTPYVKKWKTNFSPVFILKYGNKIEGVFKASCIRYEYYYNQFSHAGPGWYRLNIESQVNILSFDLLAQYCLFKKAGICFFAGPSLGVPIKIKESLTESLEGTPIDFYESREGNVSAPYFADLQAVAGIGGYTRINGKNILSLEGSFRLGIIPLNQSDSYYYDAKCRSYSIQLLISYIREVRK
jgi:hypothetical protein